MVITKLLAYSSTIEESEPNAEMAKTQTMMYSSTIEESEQVSTSFPKKVHYRIHRP